jgi:hypothetical protein
MIMHKRPSALNEYRSRGKNSFNDQTTLTPVMHPCRPPHIPDRSFVLNLVPYLANMPTGFGSTSADVSRE